MNLNRRLISSFIVLKRIFKFNLYQFQVKSLSTDLKHNFKLNPFKRRFRPNYGNDSKTITRMLITILGNGSNGQPRCLALFTDFRAYLFNCGEGVGRLCREYEILFSMIKHVFVTQNKWTNLSGLPDIYLTNEVAGLKSMSIYGPPGVEKFTNLITSHRLEMDIVKRDTYTSEDFEINYIPIESTVKNGEDVIYSYVCKIFKKLGDLNPEKCVDQGVPFGDHLLRLKNGEDVVLPDGRVIYSSDVLDSLQPASTFLVVDCPSEPYLDSFVNEKKFIQFQIPAVNASEVIYVFHFSPTTIIQTTKYQNWLNKFHQNTQHVILNSLNPSSSSEAVNQTQNILHLVHPEIFKLLPKEEKMDSLDFSGSSRIFHPPPMLQLHLRPEKKLNWDHVVNFKSESFKEMLLTFPDFNNELLKLKHLESTISKSKEINNYPEVLFLGTSSTTSTACRNVSSILVRINSLNSILLDCGEGTVMQLARYFGEKDFDSTLKSISCVFITHKHTDHYLGLFEFLEARKRAFKNSCSPYKPIALILPYIIQEVYHKYCQLFQVPISGSRIFSCKSLTSNENNQFLKSCLGNVKIQTVPVKHCLDAYGIVLQLGSKWKIVYSGDTSPCQSLITAGENCTLLIHEASIENNLASEATLKLHSTPSQVVDIAERMNAQYTIMTHFSKRYLAVPVFQTCNHRPIGYAFDFMKVRLDELPLLPLFVPALRCIFKEQLDDHIERSSTVVQFENVFLKTYKSHKPC